MRFILRIGIHRDGLGKCSESLGIELYPDIGAFPRQYRFLGKFRFGTTAGSVYRRDDQRSGAGIGQGENTFDGRPGRDIPEIVFNLGHFKCRRRLILRQTLKGVHEELTTNNRNLYNRKTNNHNHLILFGNQIQFVCFQIDINEILFRERFFLNAQLVIPGGKAHFFFKEYLTQIVGDLH